MNKIRLALLLFLFSMLSIPAMAIDSIPIDFLITGSQPDIEDDLVVYCKAGGINGYNLSTGVGFPICTDENGQSHPKTNGNIVVWSDRRNKIDFYDIYAYDIGAGTEFVIANNPALMYGDPEIDGQIVVYSARPIGTYQGGDILYGYNLNTKQEFIIDDIGTNERPKINGNRVLYKDGSRGLILYHIDSETEQLICDSEREYDIWDSFIVWTDDRDTYISAYIYNLITGSETIIWEPTTVEEQPNTIAIDNGIVVFGTRVSNWDRPIYGYDTYNQTIFPIFKDPGSVSSYSAISGNIVLFDGIYKAELPMSQIRCSERPFSDLNFDCRVDLKDLAILIQEWLTCNLNPPESCW